MHECPTHEGHTARVGGPSAPPLPEDLGTLLRGLRLPHIRRHAPEGSRDRLVEPAAAASVSHMWAPSPRARNSTSAAFFRTWSALQGPVEIGHRQEGTGAAAEPVGHAAKVVSRRWRWTSGTIPPRRRFTDERCLATWSSPWLQLLRDRVGPYRRGRAVRGPAKPRLRRSRGDGGRCRAGVLRDRCRRGSCAQSPLRFRLGARVVPPQRALTQRCDWWLRCG